MFTDVQGLLHLGLCFGFHPVFVFGQLFGANKTCILFVIPINHGIQKHGSYEIIR